MSTLTPVEAAGAAQRVYTIINSSNLDDLNDVLGDKFNLTTSSRFEATAGASIFSYKSGFGIIAPGKGQFKNEAILAIRGTQSFVKDLLMTDLNFGMRYSSTSGKMIHSGFDKVFKSFENDLIKFFSKYTPTKVHCVGHSLGGGLATLSAEWMANLGITDPVLYTFGSPRVGSEGFSRNITTKVKAENIYRVYHKTDVVSMVPLWPFVHAPLPGTECFIESPGMVPGIRFHKMKAYAGSVNEKNDWAKLKKSEVVYNIEKQVEEWMEDTSPIGLTISSIQMINKAVLYIIKKLVKMGLIALQGVLSAGLTYIDMLSMAMSRAVQLSQEVAGYIIALMRKILTAMGYAFNAATNITFEFIRWVLSTLAHNLYRLAERAMYSIYR